MNISCLGDSWVVTKRYGPSWSEGDIRGEVVVAFRARAMRLSRCADPPFTEARGIGFAARFGPMN